MAECHPVGFQWVMEAKQRGATVIHIDPRFTRTSALADAHIPIRAGSDIVLLGAVINYILTEEKYFREYVLAYTNAATLINSDFVDANDLDGVFSGYDPESGSYDTTSWGYQGVDEQAAGGDRGAGHGSESEESASERGAGHELGGHGAALSHHAVRRDDTLQDPQTVFQILKRHYARYTPELVQEACGIAPDQLRMLCEAVTANSGREKTTCWVYSVGWTHHTVGVQYIRGAAIIQLLLGNIGRPGGGILALRGHASIQGSTDIPTLFNLLPGYLPMPKIGPHDSLEDYLAEIASPDQKGFWTNAKDYTVSLLKAWWGEAATAENEFCYHYLPKLTGDHGTYATVMSMLDDDVDGYFLLGQNPAVGSAHGKMQRLGLAHLKWLVVRDLTMIESATFWKDSPEIETGELRTADIDTEVFFFPAAAHVEKDGSFTQTQRMLQWHHKAVEPPGDAQSDLQFFYLLGRKIRERLAGSTDHRDRPVLDLTWDYPADDHGEISADAVLAEINGFQLTGDQAGQPLSTFNEMKDDGSTSGGCWIYTGVYADGVNQAARRKPGTDQSWVAPEWGWAWPANRRTLYSRASADPDGRPWSERKAYVWWDAERQQWTGHDVPDFEVGKPPTYVPDDDAVGPEALRGDDAFIMQADGKGWLYAPAGLLDGPLPTHYEPQESPVANPLYRQQANPTREVFRRLDNLSNPSGRGGRLAGLPVRLHHLPADRTPHGRRNEPLATVSGRAAARVLLRGLTRAGSGAGTGERGLGDHRDGPDGGRGAGAGHRTDVAADRGRAHRAPDRTAVPLGRRSRGRRHRRLGQRPVRRHPRSERPHPGVEGGLLRHPSRAATTRPRVARVHRRLPASGRDHHRHGQCPADRAQNAPEPVEGQPNGGNDR